MYFLIYATGYQLSYIIIVISVNVVMQCDARMLAKAVWVETS